MKDHAEYPARHSHVAECHVVSSERVACWYIFEELRKAIAVREEVEKGEQDGERLLHAQKALEGPFAVVLYNRLNRIPSQTELRDDMLAYMVAIALAVPEQEAVVQRWEKRCISKAAVLGSWCTHEYIRARGKGLVRNSS